MSFRQFIVLFIWECRYQRERAAAPVPWEDTRENREDWLDGAIEDLFAAIYGEDDDEWRERIVAQPESGGDEP